MDIRIIVDSCCDLTDEMRTLVRVAPLKITIGDTNEYIDDGSIDIPALIADMSSSDKPARSACPSPSEYMSLMQECDACFVITLSAKLSGSYNAAMLARSMVLENSPDKLIHVVDSESATAGQSLLMLQCKKWIDQGLSFEEIKSRMTQRVASMHTLFVLNDLSNLMKNGRLNKVTGTIASMLSIRPLMSDDGHGEIKMLAMARGMRGALKTLISHISQMTCDAPQKSIEMVLTFCNCPARADELKSAILEKCAAIKDVAIIPTAGVATIYANNGGVVVAF